MLYDKALPCSCGKKPKLIKGNLNYVKYSCPKGCINTFHHRLEVFAREAWNSMIVRGVDKIKVKI